MKQEEFEQCLKEITPDQRRVLEPFLQGISDADIAQSLHITEPTVRKHRSNIGELFGLKLKGQRNPYLSEELLILFIKHKPDWVSPHVQDRYSLRQPEAEFPGRPVALDSQFYIRHLSIEESCYKEIDKPSALIRIRAAQKMGKTSLLNRILANARQKGYRTVYLNFGQVEESIFGVLDAFLQWFCAEVSESFGLEFQSDVWERKRIGSMRKCKDYFKQNFLSTDSPPLVLGMDETDRLFEFPKIAADFFALLRGWYEEQNDPQTWGKLRQIVVYSTDNYTKLDVNRSPFNVGLPMLLPKLTRLEVQQLAQYYGLKWGLEDEDNRLIALVGGHPYLIQLTLYHLQNGDKTFKQLLETAVTQTGIYHNHLLHLWEKLQTPLTEQTDAQSSLSDAFQQIMQSEKNIRLSPEASYKLQGLGLVELEGDRAKLSCELYRRYFTQMSN